jgi:hypothetical protein
VKKIGLCTGSMYEKISPTSETIIKLFQDIGCNAIEITCISMDELTGIKDLDERFTSGFSHVSLHAPCRDIRYGNDGHTEKVFAMIREAHQRFTFDNIVLHPDVVDRWDIIQAQGLPFAVENSDHRKPFGRTAADLREIFRFYDLGFVLDMNHCFVNDHTLRLAEDLIAEFGERIREIHLSGCHNGHHCPLHIFGPVKIFDHMPEKDVPVIIESVCVDRHMAKKEYDFIKNNLLAG